MIIFVIAVLIVLVFSMLVLGGVVSVGRKNQGADISAGLRELLLARAQGAISNEEFERAQATLHATLLAPPAEGAPGMARHLRWQLSVAIAVAFALLASVFYFSQNTPKETENATGSLTSSRVFVPQTKLQMQAPVQAQPPTQGNSGGDLNTAVKRLENKMLKTPENGDGWLLLARTYAELRQHKEAASAYAKAAAILPADATLLADWADARVVANERKWDASSRDIVKRALAADPTHLKALALAGSEAFERKDYQQAVVFWKKIVAIAPAGSNESKLAEMNIQEASAKLGSKKPG